MILRILSASALVLIPVVFCSAVAWALVVFPAPVVDHRYRRLLEGTRQGNEAYVTFGWWSLIGTLFLAYVVALSWQVNAVYGLAFGLCAVATLATLIACPFVSVGRYFGATRGRWATALKPDEVRDGLHLLVRWDLRTAFCILGFLDAVAVYVVLMIAGRDAGAALTGGAVAVALVAFAGISLMRCLDRRMAPARFLICVDIALGLAFRRPPDGFVLRVAPGRHQLVFGLGGTELLDSLQYLRGSLLQIFTAMPAIDPIASIKAAEPLFRSLREQAVSGDAITTTAELRQAVRAVLGRPEPTWLQLRNVTDSAGWNRASKLPPVRRWAAVLTAVVAAISTITGLLGTLK